MQYGVHPFISEGCSTCASYKHDTARCHVDDPENSEQGVYVGIGLSPCEKYKKGFEFVPNSWGRFRKVDAN